MEINTINKKEDEFYINYYSSAKDCKVKELIPISKWFEMIKLSDYSNFISAAREERLDYDEVKLFRVPAVTINFQFDKYKENKNVIQPTGLLYIDIDSPDFDVKALKKNDAYAVYRSFGGAGYGIIVKVGGLSLNNFESTYNYICNTMGISDYVDTGAKKASQFNVLTHDPNITINTKSKIFKCINTPLVKNKEEEEHIAQEGGYREGSSVRFDNKSDFNKEGTEYTVNWGNISIVQAKLLHKRIPNINRNGVLLSYCTNLVWLNPNIYPDRLFSIMNAVNSHNFDIPVDNEQLNRVIKTVLKYKKEGTLNPIVYKKSNMVFNTNSTLSKEEKFKIINKERVKNMESNTRIKIERILKDWNFIEFGVVSQFKMYKNHPISKKTIEKYYREFKDKILIMNKKYLESSE